jgi:type VI secretion system protein ImpK
MTATTSMIAEPAVPAFNEVTGVPTLCDLLEDGIYLLFLLRDGNAPASAADFNRRIDSYVADFSRRAEGLRKPLSLVQDSLYAFCALLDEIVLASGFPLRVEWARTPLQLRLFKEHLAGEGFFRRLEALREAPEKNIEALEVYHACLLLGFQGKYLLKGPEKRGYLVRQLGHDIQRVRGKKADFAPGWKLPHRFENYMRFEMPLWAWLALMALAAAGTFGVFRWLLDRQFVALA